MLNKTYLKDQFIGHYCVTVLLIFFEDCMFFDSLILKIFLLLCHYFVTMDQQTTIFALGHHWLLKKNATTELLSVFLLKQPLTEHIRMYIRHIDLKYLHLICILSVFYLFKNIIIRTFVYVWKPKNKRRRGLLRKCAFFVRIQAAINGFQTFYASNRAASPQLIQ